MFTGYFAARLRCPLCSRETDERIQTAVPFETADGRPREYREGDPIDFIDPTVVGYNKVRGPAPGEPVHILQIWDCLFCGTPRWAEVVIDGERVRSIRATPLDAATLDRLHYITSEINFYFEQITGQPFAAAGSDFADVLRRALTSKGEHS